MENKYFMGIDTYDLDSNNPSSAICILSKDDEGEITLEYMGRYFNKEEFEKDVDKYQEYYNCIAIKEYD